MALGDWLGAALAFLGPAGLLLAMYLIFLVDAAIFPALPEVFILLFYSELTGPWRWAAFPTSIALLTLALAGDVSGNTLLYTFVKRAKEGRHTPRLFRRWGAYIERKMKAWTALLLVRDERVILVNRIAPAVPLTGAFIAVCGWNLRKSLLYVVIGGTAKYAILLAVFVWLGYAVDPDTARWISILAVVVLVAVSLGAGRYRKKRVGAA